MADLQYQLVFSLFSHPVLGILIEPFLIQKNASGSLSLRFQKVSNHNIKDFYPVVSEHEIRLLEILDEISNQGLAKIINTGISTLESALLKISAASDTKNRSMFQFLRDKITEVKNKFFAELQATDLVFETGKDGYPAWLSLTYRPDVSFQFQFDFQNDALLVKPEFSAKELNGKPISILDEFTPIALVGQTLIPIPETINPKRLKPFGEKQFIQVERRHVKTYTEKIVLPDLENGSARMKGNVVQKEIGLDRLELFLSFNFVGSQLTLFETTKSNQLQLPDFLSIETRFYYGDQKSNNSSQWQNEWQIAGENPMVLQQLVRDTAAEQKWTQYLYERLQVEFKKGAAVCTFLQLRDTILPVLDSIDPAIKVSFSPEFSQLVMKPAKLSFTLLDRIDYFKIEGSVTWDDISIDLSTFRKQYTGNSSWVKNGDQFLLLSGEDQIFLNQFFNLAQGTREVSIPKKTVYAVQQAKESLFASQWNQFTSALEVSSEEPFDAQLLSPNIELRDYQVKGIEWLVRLSSYGLGGILADDMGLGKTFQATAFLTYQLSLENKLPMLIIVPSTLIFNWQYELKRFSDDFRILVHAGPNRAKSLKNMIKHYNIWLVSYQTVARDIHLFKDLKFSTVIADEAHQLKNPATVGYKAISGLNAEVKFLLTGTPLQNSPLDLWALSELVNPGLLSQRIKPQALQKIEATDAFLDKLKLLQALVQPFMLRRTKQNVLKELPPKTVSYVYCNMSEDQEKEYVEYNELLIADLQNMNGATTSGRNVKILRALTILRLLSNHPSLIGSEAKSGSGKFDLVLEKLREVLSEGHKVLIFSTFIKHLQLYADHLEKEGTPFAMLTGQTKGGDREKEVRRFREREEVQVFLISLKAGGVGLNLVEASYVFLLDPWWNPAAELQAMDRVYRIGQKNPVNVFKFITSNSVEEKIVQLQERKQMLTDQVIDDQSLDKPAFTIDALRDILFSNLK